VPKLEQLIPLGALVTTPIPPPAVLTTTSSSPGTNPTQPTQVIIAIRTTGNQHFPKLDILLPFPFTGSHFDEQAAELVGFQLCSIWWVRVSDIGLRVQFHSLAQLC
jgi:hypothetical protein